jgi:hypothetical protein
VTNTPTGRTLTGAAESASPAAADPVVAALEVPSTVAETPASPDEPASCTTNSSTVETSSLAKEVTTPATGFACFGLRQELLDGLEAIGFREPSPI